MKITLFLLPAAFRIQLDTISRGYDGQTWPPKTIIPPDNAPSADKSVSAARILWEKPNRDWDKR